MEFVDNSGHIFSLPSYNKQPIGYEFEETPYIFWFNNNGLNLSVGNYYLQTINLLIELDNFDVSWDDFDNVNIEIKIDHSSVYSLISTETIQNIIKDKIDIKDATIRINNKQLTDTLSNNDLVICKVNTSTNISCVLIPIYVVGYSDNDGSWISNILVHISGNELGEEIWCPISVGGIWQNQLEQLVVNGQNMGVSLPRDILKAVYDSPFRNQNFNETLYNQKLKEYLLNYMNIKGEVGNYRSILNSLEWFGWGKYINISHLLKTDNTVQRQFILDYFNTKTDILESFNTFAQTTLLSLYVPLKKESEDRYGFDYNNGLYGEDTPILDDLLNKMLFVNATPNSEASDDFWYLKPYYRYMFFELGLKLACLKQMYQKYFLPIHMKLKTVSVQDKVYTNDIKLINIASSHITQKNINMISKNDDVIFTGRGLHYFCNQIHYVDENMNEFEAFDDEKDNVYYINDTSLNIPIKFKNNVYHNCVLLLEKKNNTQPQYKSYIQSRVALSKEEISKLIIYDQAGKELSNMVVSTNDSNRENGWSIYNILKSEDLDKNTKYFIRIKYNQDFISLALIGDIDVTDKFSIYYLPSSTLIFESHFSFFTNSDDRFTYRDFVIYPKIMSQPSLDVITNERIYDRTKITNIDYWINQNFTLRILDNNVWYTYDFTTKIHDMHIQLGTLQYKYWNNELNNRTNFSQLSYIANKYKDGEKSLAFNSFMWEPRLVTTNNITFFDDIVKYHKQQNMKYYDGSLIGDVSQYFSITINDVQFNFPISELGKDITISFSGDSLGDFLLDKTSLIYMLSYTLSKEHDDYIILENLNNSIILSFDSQTYSYTYDNNSYSISTFVNKSYNDFINKYISNINIYTGKHLNNIHVFDIYTKKKVLNEASTNLFRLYNNSILKYNGITFSHINNYDNDGNYKHGIIYLSGQYNNRLDNDAYINGKDEDITSTRDDNIDLYNDWQNIDDVIYLNQNSSTQCIYFKCNEDNKIVIDGDAFVVDNKAYSSWPQDIVPLYNKNEAPDIVFDNYDKLVKALSSDCITLYYKQADSLIPLYIRQESGKLWAYESLTDMSTRYKYNPFFTYHIVKYDGSDVNINILNSQDIISGIEDSSNLSYTIVCHFYIQPNDMQVANYQYILTTKDIEELEKKGKLENKFGCKEIKKDMISTVYDIMSYRDTMSDVNIASNYPSIMLTSESNLLFENINMFYPLWRDTLSLTNINNIQFDEIDITDNWFAMDCADWDGDYTLTFETSSSITDKLHYIIYDYDDNLIPIKTQTLSSGKSIKLSPSSNKRVITIAIDRYDNEGNIITFNNEWFVPTITNNNEPTYDVIYEKLSYVPQKSGTTLNIDINGKTYQVDDNASEDVWNLYHTFFKNDCYGDNNYFNFIRQIPSLGDTKLSYDFYLMHDYEYWYGVFISKEQISSVTTSSDLKINNVYRYENYLGSQHNWTESNKGKYSPLKYGDNEQYAFVYNSTCNKFLINRMMFVDSQGVNKFNTDDIIVGVLANNSSLPFILDNSSKWSITPLSIGMKTSAKVNNNQDMFIMSVPTEDTKYASGYYNLTCRYSLDKTSQQQCTKIAKFMIQ